MFLVLSSTVSLASLCLDPSYVLLLKTVFGRCEVIRFVSSTKVSDRGLVLSCFSLTYTCRMLDFIGSLSHVRLRQFWVF
ncbi:hypothetical protein F2Q69_00048733 [Brassica cretica]|uniref:Secreted protein n=1 Tax=Brassica cretica TaxID=69181 RepID=A0A8S9Q5A7_BRACR|nr:hypothetical protein F2Q69_00048733 [Brassica cretica]